MLERFELEMLGVGEGGLDVPGEADRDQSIESAPDEEALGGKRSEPWPEAAVPIRCL